METLTSPFPRGLQKALAGPTLQLTAIPASTGALPPALQNRALTHQPFPARCSLSPETFAGIPQRDVGRLAALHLAAGIKSGMWWAGHGTVPLASPSGFCAEPWGEDSFPGGVMPRDWRIWASECDLSRSPDPSRQLHHGLLMSKMLAGFSTALGSHCPSWPRGGGKGAPFSASLSWVLAGARARLRAAIHPSAAANPAPAYRQGGDTTGGQGKPPF